jgi:Uma2 family endonuclease
VCDETKLDDKGCLGAPDLVVEVLSPGNNAKELRNKYEVYEQSGVKEYWIVSPQDETFLIYTLVDGHYQPSRVMTYGDTVVSSVLPGFSLDIAALFTSAKK